MDTSSIFGRSIRNIFIKMVFPRFSVRMNEKETLWIFYLLFRGICVFRQIPLNNIED